MEPVKFAHIRVKTHSTRSTYVAPITTIQGGNYEGPAQSDVAGNLISFF